MTPQLRQRVRERAGHRCEYCRFHESHLPLWSFHVDHIVAEQHRGTDDPANLAWSCRRCNLCKGTNLTAVAPDTGQIVALYNPRADSWADHFAFDGNRVVGLTASGRATVALLQMNAEKRVEIRAELRALGDWAPGF